MDRPVEPALAGQILALETALATRNPSGIEAELEDLLDADFVEFGSSGRRWDRASTVELLGRPSEGSLTIDRFAVAALADGVVLATYRSVAVTPNGTRHEARRSSIWIHRDGDWRIRFHQGTSIPLDEPDAV